MRFDPITLSRTTDPDTSHAAALTVQELREHHMTKIVNALTYPMTAEQIADCIDLDYVAVNRRMREIEKSGLVVETTDRRKNRSGRYAIVWRRK